MSKTCSQLFGPDVDPAFVQRCLQQQAEEIKHVELEEAISKLEKQGNLTNEQQRAIENLASTLVQDIIAAPESMLETPQTDPEAVRSVARLFDLETDP